MPQPDMTNSRKHIAFNFYTYKKAEKQLSVIISVLMAEHYAHVYI